MGSISELFKNDLLHQDSAIPLDFDTLKSVPESYKWPLESSIHSVDSNEKSKMLPIIDLTHPDAQELVAHAARTWGMFLIVNHGVSLDLIQNVENEARRLFNLPTHDKMKVLRSPENVAGYGVARIAPFYDKCMWHEGFAILESCVDHAKKLWPHDYEGFCNTMMEFRKKMKPVGDQLLHYLLKSLDISEEDIKTWAASTNKVEGTIQLNSYPPCPDSSVLGLAPHTDTMLLTILNQCRIPGLEIFRDDVGWVSVPPVSGAFVVNVGDILHILSNGKFPSAYHRVTVSENKHRISFAYFHGPSSVESHVEPLNKLEKPLYRSLPVKEFLVIKAKHNEKALSLVKM